MITIVLIEPQIPPNTGNVARLCAALEIELHIVGKLGFELSDKTLKRAGLDYWPYVKWQRFEDTAAYMAHLPRGKAHLFTKTAETTVYEHTFREKDVLLFGSEVTGIPQLYLDQFTDRCCSLPIKSTHVRSLNLSTAVGIGVYEAIRQLGPARFDRHITG
jgi:tRNA (cytidine/uridine-2'-O-)-methyltransferase